jgi:hypothetical protein
VAHEALSLCKLEQNAGAIITRFFLIWSKNCILILDFPPDFDSIENSGVYR